MWLAGIMPGLGGSAQVAAQSITLDQQDAIVWMPEQVIHGAIEGNLSGQGVLWLNGAPSYSFQVEAGANHFEAPVRLTEGENVLAATLESGGETVYSDTLRLTMGYRQKPEAYAFATVSGRTVALHGKVLENPDSLSLSYAWEQHPSDSLSLAISGSADTVAVLEIPTDAPYGEYHFDFVVAAADGDSTRAGTIVTISPEGVEAFDIREDHASWIDSAIIYEVLPFNFSRSGNIPDITARLPELKALGVNTIWLQPIFPNAGYDFGYEVLDYFTIRSDYGNEADLRRFVQEAHQRGMKVILDFVPNHTHIDHRYARDAIAHGPASHYYDFYQRERDAVPYSQHYHQETVGKMQFVYYFWNELVNLNYNNPEVRRWITEAGQYWIEEFDIDGYRLDAVWGVNARTPEAMQEFRFDLKRIKPEILLLGEDKATVPATFDNRFDVAYDWYPEQSWVSHWTWERDFSADESVSYTIFNDPNVGNRAAGLRNALTNRGNGFAPNAKVLRFMENNDTPRFHKTHDLERTRMAAALLFALPGIPLLYNGQEVGYRSHPYSTQQIYARGRPIREQDPHGLYSYYHHLILLRKAFPALYGDHFREIPIGPSEAAGQAYAFHRWKEDQNVLGLINMGPDPVEAGLSVPVEEMGIDPAVTYYLTDLITGDYETVQGEALATLSVPVEGYTARLFLLDDEVAAVPTGIQAPQEETPTHFVLSQNYPNPFNPTTTIAFELPDPAEVRLSVFDVLGREVAVLIDGYKASGQYTIQFDAGRLASGLYLYRLTTPFGTATRQMLLIR